MEEGVAWGLEEEALVVVVTVTVVALMVYLRDRFKVKVGPLALL